MNTRTLLVLLLVFLGMMMYVEWQSQFNTQTPAPVEPLPGAESVAATRPTNGEQAVPDLPDMVDSASTAVPQPNEDVAAALPAAQAIVSGTRIEVRTDRLMAHINPVGGALMDLRLLRYPVRVDQPDQPFPLLSENQAEWFVAQAGLVDRAGLAPNHTDTFEYDREFYQLAPGQERVEVPLTWRGPDGLEVIQTWIFKRDTYVVEHQLEIINPTSSSWSGSRYLQLQRTPKVFAGGMTFTNPERISYNGAAVYDPVNKFRKLPFDEFAEEPFQASAEGGWAGMVQHYFLASWIPQANQLHRYTTRQVDRVVPNRYALSATSGQITVEPGGRHAFNAELFAGPKQQRRLDDVAPGLSLTVDYGMFTIFSKPLFWLLDQIHSLVKNWGVAIILLTLLIKLAFYKLTQAQFRSMGKLRKLQPRIQQLKERYGDDRQKFGQAMMDIYKKEKVNPLGGCLPILVQIPIFIALYWVLLESVELRQAGFLWVPDLSRPDPYFILPIINGAFMIITQRLTPMVGMDPMQRKVMQYLPVVFAVLFAFFPAGLVLYWAANSGISLAQQWFILRQLDAEEACKN
ncbi:MAG: membrane protein insertase YidC [Pseudomonadota bacterium]